MLDALIDALIDTAKILPFLFLTYLAMEYLEHRAGKKADPCKEGGMVWPGNRQPVGCCTPVRLFYGGVQPVCGPGDYDGNFDGGISVHL